MKQQLKQVLCVLVIAAGLIQSAYADASIGDEVSESLTLGKRTFALPPGKWIVVAENANVVSINQGQGAGGTIKSQYLAQLDASNVLVAAISFRTTIDSSAVSTWNDSTCDRKDTLFRDTLDGNFKYPACHLINHVTGFLNSAPSNEYDKRIWSWYKDKKVNLPETAIASIYVKYFAGDFVQIRMFNNPELAGVKPDGKKAWGESAWHPSLISSSTERSNYLAAVKKWNESLITNGRASLYDGKPVAASLPSLPTL
jgi:hypothetical protein